MKKIPLALLVGALTLLVSCEDESVPTSPPPPFLFTDLLLSKETSPTPSTPLSEGQDVLLLYKASYTLNPGDNAQQANLALFVNVFGQAPDGSIVGIGQFPNHMFSPLVVSDIVRDSIPFVVPQGVSTVFVQAFLDTLPFANPVIALDNQSWPVR
ncbi:MAG: hypothetical protein KAJ12_00945 [Bacteroidetes bacterium]|nr:hypothetical protein [Bacteroidota bacterium]